jgi:hypothetical protein
MISNRLRWAFGIVVGFLVILGVGALRWCSVTKLASSTILNGQSESQVSRPALLKLTSQFSAVQLIEANSRFLERA